MHSESHEYEQILQQILSKYDLTRQGEIDRAYESCVDYARTYLLNDPNCNAFLQMAARKLETVPYHLDTIVLKTTVPDEARLDLYVSDENEIVLSGNDAGLDYLIELLQKLKDSETEDHFHLLPKETALTSRSWPMVVYHEETEWFEEQEREAEAEETSALASLPKPQEISAIQFLDSPPKHLNLLPRKIYPARWDEKTKKPSTVTWEKGSPDEEGGHWAFFKVRNEEGRWLHLRLNLNDPEVVFFSSRDLEGLR